MKEFFSELSYYYKSFVPYLRKSVSIFYPIFISIMMLLSRGVKGAIQSLNSDWVFSDDMLGDAKSVVNDYKKNPSEISGSEIRISADSPFLDERFSIKDWKRVVYPNSLNDKEFIEHIKKLRENKKLDKNIETIIHKGSNLLFLKLQHLKKSYKTSFSKCSNISSSVLTLSSTAS